MKIELMCQDHGNPGCLDKPDDRYTMDYTDIGQGYIYWCANCGPVANEVEKALIAALMDRGTEFRIKFAQAVSAAEKETAEGKS